jgi:DHHC palmitoyltransferase
MQLLWMSTQRTLQAQHGDWCVSMCHCRSSVQTRVDSILGSMIAHMTCSLPLNVDVQTHDRAVAFLHVRATLRTWGHALSHGLSQRGAGSTRVVKEPTGQEITCTGLLSHGQLGSHARRIVLSCCAGVCVHKFDHSCWLLSSDIGDKNHREFITYIFLECFLVCWAISACLQVAICMPSTAMRLGCSQTMAARAAMLIMALAGMTSLCFFGYLLILHVYLALTNQTTYEVIRGSRVPYLSQFYSESQQQAYPLPHSLLKLLWDDIRGVGPPKPFSRGIAANMVLFWLNAWPRTHATVMRCGTQV